MLVPRTMWCKGSNQDHTRKMNNESWKAAFRRRARESQQDTNFGGIGVKSNIREWKLSVLFCASAAILLASLTYAATNPTRHLAAGEKVKVTGSSQTAGPGRRRSGNGGRRRDRDSEAERRGHRRRQARG